MSKIVKSPAEFLTSMLEKNRIPVLKFSQDVALTQPVARAIVAGKTRITVPVAVRLARYFNTNPEYWLKMQMDWDLVESAQDRKLAEIVKKISKFEKGPVVPKKAAAKKAVPVKAKAAGKKAAGKKAAGKPAAAKKAGARGKPGRPAGKPAAK